MAKSKKVVISVSMEYLKLILDLKDAEIDGVEYNLIQDELLLRVVVTGPEPSMTSGPLQFYETPEGGTFWKYSLRVGG